MLIKNNVTYPKFYSKCKLAIFNYGIHIYEQNVHHFSYMQVGNIFEKIFKNFNII